MQTFPFPFPFPLPLSPSPQNNVFDSLQTILSAQTNFAFSFVSLVWGHVDLYDMAKMAIKARNPTSYGSMDSIKYHIGNQIACHGKKTNNQNMINRPTAKSPCKSQHQTSTDVNLQGASAILVAIIFQRCIHSLRCDRNPMLSNHSAQHKAYQGKVPAWVS